MEKKIYEAYQKVSSNKVYSVLTSVLFPIFLVVMCFININKGIDITDTTYSLSNFLNIDKLDSMWFASTLYANLLGSLLVKLPGGMTLLGITAYTAVIKAAIALIGYFFFVGFCKFSKEIVFFSEVISLSLCWCPVTILYNYFSYLLFFAGVVVLYKGIITKRNYMFIIAGFILGSNVFVRLPNVVEASMILLVWYGVALYKGGFLEGLKKTLLCMAGYFLAFIPALIALLATRGIKDYITGIMEMLASGESASDYAGFGMIMKIVSSYVATWPYLEIAIIMLLLVLLESLVLPSKFNAVRYILAIPIALATLYLQLRKGIFTFDYSSYSSIYNIGKLIVCLMLIMFIIILFMKKESAENKLLAFASILIIAITPLGTNNELYANLNNLFFVMPVFACLLFRFVDKNEHVRPIRFAVSIFILAFAFQSILFGLTFKFRDAAMKELKASVNNNPVLAGMKTTEGRAKELRELSLLWQEKGYSEDSILAYGNVCGLGFILKSEMAIDTFWPSLATYSAEKFETEVKRLTTDINSKGKAPVVVIDNAEYSNMNTSANEKQIILKNFLSEFKYSVIYNNKELVVLEAQLGD